MVTEVKPRVFETLLQMKNKHQHLSGLFRTKLIYNSYTILLLFSNYIAWHVGCKEVEESYRFKKIMKKLSD